jgi:SnoaL-like domain
MALRTLPAIICLLLAIPSHATAQQSSTEDTAFADVQKHFAEAYNNKDVDAMAAAFTENGIRVTPSGNFQGRDSIRRNLQDVLNMGLHDYQCDELYRVWKATSFLMPGSGRPSWGINLSTAITPRSLSARVTRQRSWKRRLLSPHFDRKAASVRWLGEGSI